MRAPAPSLTKHSMNTPVRNTTSLDSSTGRVGPWPRAFLFAAVALILLITALRASVCWTNDAEVSHAAGVIITMAADLKNGLFYRPLFGPVGYGGTRYFPLYFCLHALLLKLGMPILLSAYLLSAAGIILLMVGTFYLLRELRVEPWLAACSAGVLLASGSAQLSLVSPHPDGLASALNVWGLAVIARPRPSRRKILLASALFTLAWSAKFTTVFGLAAAFVWLLSTGFPHMAWQLAAETLSGYSLVAGAVVFASQGRALEIFRACASGGTNLMLMASGPWNMTIVAAQGDRGLLLFVFLALLAFASLAFSASSWQNLPALFFIATIAVTAAIFGSPGTNNNHLLDIQIAAVILFTTWLANRASPLQKQLGVCAFALATLAAVIPLWHHLKAWDRPYHPRRFQTVLALVGDTQKPVLTENPVIPVLRGGQPYVLDPWMVQLLRKRIPNFEEPLLEALRNRSFGAVVLMKNPATDFGRWWYETASFGPGFVSAVSENYRLALVIDDQRVYLPITDSSRETRTK